jgi:hypothetical protein
VNDELARAEQALDRGDRAEARVHAWNALANIESADGPRLRRVASKLDDQLLIEEVERRVALPADEVEPEAKNGFRLRSLIFPIIVVVALLLLAINTIGSEAGPPKPIVERAGVPTPANILATETTGVWIAQVGLSNRMPLEKLAADLEGRYGIPVGVLPRVFALPTRILDPRRNQLDGDALMGFLATQYDIREQAAVIGVTDYSMFSKTLAVGRPFLLRARANYGLVSTADFGAGAYPRLRGHTRYERTRKLVARAIGFLYLHRPVSKDPHSLLRSSMSSTDEIDALHEKL